MAKDQAERSSFYTKQVSTEKMVFRKNRRRRSYRRQKADKNCPFVPTTRAKTKEKKHRMDITSAVTPFFLPQQRRKEGEEKEVTIEIEPEKIDPEKTERERSLPGFRLKSSQTHQRKTAIALTGFIACLSFLLFSINLVISFGREIMENDRVLQLFEKKMFLLPPNDTYPNP